MDFFSKELDAGIALRVQRFMEGLVCAKGDEVAVIYYPGRNEFSYFEDHACICHCFFGQHLHFVWFAEQVERYPYQQLVEAGR